MLVGANKCKDIIVSNHNKFSLHTNETPGKLKHRLAIHCHSSIKATMGVPLRLAV